MSLLLFLALSLSPPAQLKVEGESLSENGQPVQLRGITLRGFETSNGPDDSFRSARVAVEDWGANCIRLPVSQDRWFGKVEGQKDRGEAYKESVDELITYASNRHQFVVIELASSDVNSWGKNLGPHNMPDDNSLEFWKDMAIKYRGTPHVLFGLYSKPHGVSWAIWKLGGEVREAGLTYHTPGFQPLLDVIRKLRAKNVCVVGGLGSGTDLSGPLNGTTLEDPNGNGVLYEATLPLDPQGWGNLPVGKLPLFFGEFSSKGPATSTATFAFLKNPTINWAPFEFQTEFTPKILEDDIYTPTGDWGVALHSALRG